MEPLAIAQAFVDRINAQDVDGLVALMTENHRFIDSLGQVITGRETLRGGWRGYFGMVQGYRLVAEHRELFAKAGYSEIQVFEEYEKGWLCAVGRRQG